MHSYQEETFRIALEAEFCSRNSDAPMCQHPGCQNAAIQCSIPGGFDHDTGKDYDDSYEYHCVEHARDAGFCCCCGAFIAGSRDFSDLCENCEDELKADERDPEDDDEYPGPIHDDRY